MQRKMKFAYKWMEVEKIILSEVTQTHKEKAACSLSVVLNSFSSFS